MRDRLMRWLGIEELKRVVTVQAETLRWLKEESERLNGELAAHQAEIEKLRQMVLAHPKAPRIKARTWGEVLSHVGQ